MNFIKKVFSDLNKKCKHSRIESNSNATQNNDACEIQSSQLSEDKDFEDYHHKCDNFATDKNITNENNFNKNVKFINKLIPHKTIDNNNCSKSNYAENKTKELSEANSFDKELISDSINSNLSPKIIDEDKESSEILIDKLDNDKYINLAEYCIASEINLDKISITDILSIDKNESNTEIELTDNTHNIDGDNESVTSDSILVGIDLDEEYYSDLKKKSEHSKLADNLKTELENTCIEINISESSNDPSKVNKEPSYLFEPDNIDNDYKNVCNSEMLVSLEEFDRILQRYSNDKEKGSHWDPNDCKNCNKSIIDPLSIDEIDDFISNLNETQPNIITKPKGGIIEIDISGAINNYYEQFSQPIKSQSILFDEILKDDVISISSEEHIELKINVRDNDIDTISIKSSDSDCSGYHSSDFEFISEREAKLDGFIINFVPPKVDKPVPRFERPNIIRSSNKELPGPSRLLNRENSNNQDICKIITINESYRQVHEIPEGDNYLNLFQGIYNPVLPNSAIYFLENKSVRVTGMHVEFEGLGFDRQMAERRRYDDSDDEFKEEAQESLKKILSMYPRENRKRRRRF